MSAESNLFKELKSELIQFKSPGLLSQVEFMARVALVLITLYENCCLATDCTSIPIYFQFKSLIFPKPESQSVSHNLQKLDPISQLLTNLSISALILNTKFVCIHYLKNIINNAAKDGLIFSRRSSFFQIFNEIRILNICK